MPNRKEHPDDMIADIEDAAVTLHWIFEKNEGLLNEVFGKSFTYFETTAHNLKQLARHLKEQKQKRIIEEEANRKKEEKLRKQAIEVAVLAKQIYDLTNSRPGRTWGGISEIEKKTYRDAASALVNGGWSNEHAESCVERGERATMMKSPSFPIKCPACGKSAFCYQSGTVNCLTCGAIGEFPDSMYGK
jgi:ribosomal protein S27E